MGQEAPKEGQEGQLGPLGLLLAGEGVKQDTTSVRCSHQVPSLCGTSAIGRLRAGSVVLAVLLIKCIAAQRRARCEQLSFSVVDNVRQASGGASSARGRRCRATRVRLRLYLFVRDSVGVVLTLCGHVDSPARST